MSVTRAADRHKLVQKTKSVEQFPWGCDPSASLTSSSGSLQQSPQRHVIVSEADDILGVRSEWDECHGNFDNTCTFSLTDKQIKKRNLRSNDPNLLMNDSFNEICFVKIGNRGDLCTEHSSHSDRSDLSFVIENANFKKSEHMPPSEEELEVGSVNLSKSNSAHSLSGHDNSLGKTLATSLKLIATNSAASPLALESVHSDGDSFRAETISSTSSTHASDVVTPVVVLSPTVSQMHLPIQPPKRYTTRSSINKKEEFSKRRSHDYQMMKPILSKDGSVTLYQCEKCNKVFNKKQTLRQHFITHTDRFACPFCDTRCKSKGDLHRHIQTHTKEKPYHCDVCNTDYTRETILRKHMKTQLHMRACYERENIACLHKMMDNNSKNKSLDKFSTTQTKVKLEGFSCSQCEKVTFSKAEYKKHVKSHALKNVCNVCQKGCKSALLLKIHLRSHSRSSRLSCKMCSRSFANLYSLKEHTKTHKSKHSSRVVEESLIKAAINKHNKDVLKIKKKSDAAEDSKSETDKTCSSLKMKKLECEECHKNFTSEKRLANHNRVHNGTYLCGVCKKAFSTLSKMKIHLKFHGKIVKCDICSAVFYDDKELEDHVQKQHVVENGYTCKLCYDQFESAAELQSHMKDHAPTMLFSGKSLDETALPVIINRNRRKPSSSGIEVHGLNGYEDSSDNEEMQTSKRLDKSVPAKLNDTSNNNLLSSQEFYEIINSVLDESDGDDNVSDSESYDLDDEIYSDIFEALQSENISSEESDNEDSKDSAILQKPILLEEVEIMRNYYADYERYSEKDDEKQIFRCKLCNTAFEDDTYLKNHLKCHLCEYCNKFFAGKERLTAHKSRHVRHLLKQIKNEVSLLHAPRQKLKDYFMDSSDSENELEDQFLNELEDILEGEPAKVPRSVNFLHSLSHDEIVRANKHIFEQYSCLDLINNIFACTICKRKYARPTTLTRHLKTHVCQFCNKFFEDKSDLLEHKYKHRKKAALMKAEITGEGSKMPPSPVVSKPNRDMFKRYSFINSERNINRCTLCCKDFVRRTVLTRHMKTHICSHCDKFFEDKYDLAKHINFHQVEKQYMEDDEFIEYDDDEKQYSANSSVVGNLDHDEKNIAMPSSFPSALHHLNPSFHTQSACSSRNGTITFIQIPSTEGSEPTSTQVFSAPVNGTSSFQIISQPVEVYKDSAQESFLVASTSCQGNDSDKIITISQPQIVASGAEGRERLFECGECGKRFFKNGHLKSHMTIHTGDRPYVCRLCGKAFGRGTTLRKHEKTHMKRCKICDTSFSHKFELDLHMEIHRTYAFYK